MKIYLETEEVPKLKEWCGLRIWIKPKDFHKYAIGADVAEGVGQDASTAQVIDCMTGQVVACFWSNFIDTDNYASELYKLGFYYNKAHLCIEANNHGNAIIAHLGGALGGLMYPNLYKRYVLDEYTQKRTKKIGFHTTSGTKAPLIANLKNAIRDGETTTYDKETIEEMMNFVKDSKTGRMAAAGNSRDDRVMAYALAWEQTRILRETGQASLKPERSFEQRYDPYTGELL